MTNGRESKEEKGKRLAEQLRANLRRRKAQSRALDGADAGGKHTPPASDTE